MIAPSLSTFRIKPQISTFSLSDDVTQEVENIPGKLWIDKIHTAFEEIDVENKGVLNLSQFKTSRLRFLITGVRLNDYQMENYFRQIDSNGIDQITFKELIDFLMSMQRSLTAKNVEKTLKVTFLGPDEKTAAQYSRTMTVIRTFYVPLLSEIAVLCDNALLFYSYETVRLTQIFSDGDSFVDCVYLPIIFKIAICKQNREVIFYDVRSRDKTSFSITASLDVSNITKMNIRESRKTSQWCHQKEMPLFNRSTSIGAHPNQSFIFIGDEKGGIEIINVFMSQYKGKFKWEYQRIGRCLIHSSDVTQITYIPKLELFCSSSTDGTISLWKYSFKKHKLTIKFTYKDSMGLSIRSFVYSERTRDIVYNTSSFSFSVWRIFTNNQTTIDTHSQIIQTMAVFPLLGDQAFLITVSRTNFFSVYRMPDMELTANWFMGLMHQLCPPTQCLIVDKTLFLCGAFISTWHLESSDGDGLKPHNHPVIGAFTNDIFDMVISIDNQGDVSNWNFKTGRKENWYTLNETENLVKSVALDKAQRRMAVGYEDGHVKIVSANSGSVLNVISNEYIEGGCHHINFATIFDQKRILCCSGIKSIVLFEDYPGSRTRFMRNFIGHTENVNRTVVLKNSRVLSIGMEHELFLWKVHTQNPIMRYQMPNDPTVAVDLEGDENNFLVGDVAGFIYFMSLESPTPISTINAFHMSIQSPITTMEMCSGYPLLVAGNLHGYVKYWFFLGDKLEDLRQFRAHTDAILSISISQKMRIVVTAGKDEQIRMWSVEPFGLIGSFGLGKLWKINHLDLWESENPLPDDPAHFEEPEEDPNKNKKVEVVEEEEVEEEIEEEEKKEKFDFNTVLDIYDNTEKILEKGQKINQKASVIIKMPPPSQMKSPRKPLITFDQYMENRDMEGTIKKISKMLRPKITRPSTPSKS